MNRARVGAIAYWTGAALLTVLGFLDLIAIGGPFFLTGLAMLAVGRWRHDRAVLWPTLTGGWAFVLGYVLFGPLGCTSSAVPAGSGLIAGRTSCTNVLGLDYSGGLGYQPPMLPALLAGLALGLCVALVARWLLRPGMARTA